MGARSASKAHMTLIVTVRLETEQNKQTILLSIIYLDNKVLKIECYIICYEGLKVKLPTIQYNPVRQINLKRVHTNDQISIFCHDEIIKFALICINQ